MPAVTTAVPFESVSVEDTYDIRRRPPTWPWTLPIAFGSAFGPDSRPITVVEVSLTRRIVASYVCTLTTLPTTAPPASMTTCSSEIPSARPLLMMKVRAPMSVMLRTRTRAMIVWYCESCWAWASLVQSVFSCEMASIRSSFSVRVWFSWRSFSFWVRTSSNWVSV